MNRKISHGLVMFNKTNTMKLNFYRTCAPKMRAAANVQTTYPSHYPKHEQIKPHTVKTNNKLCPIHINSPLTSARGNTNIILFNYYYFLIPKRKNIK
mmetsp:Transcript_23940/g.36904  ORF Transcript_23940/g.36904 Transcript_23940/m.36904 type:complete len:97 (-) Transcript_23940:73-363(-)